MNLGIARPLLDFEQRTLQHLCLQYSRLKICELGNQRFGSDIFLPSKVAKNYYTAQGAEHVSLDLNGKDGALKVDLDYPIPPQFREQFDIVTNYGTIEHVNNQFEAFKNMHNLAKTGGWMIHSLPVVNNWPNHCRYYYPENFPLAFSEANEYGLVSITIQSNYYDNRDGEDKKMIFVTLWKTRSDFMTEEEFSKLPIIDSGNTKKTSDYDQTNAILFSIKNRAFRALSKHPRARSLVRKTLGKSN